jgi:hypothetical protein
MVTQVVLELTLTAFMTISTHTLVLRQADQRSLALANDEHIAQTEINK